MFAHLRSLATRLRGQAARRRRLLILVLAGVLLLAAGLGAFLILRAGGDSTLDAILRKGVLRVAMDPSFPPFENLDAQGKLAGFDVDLSEAIAARLGVRCEIVPMGFDQILDAVAAGQVDGAVSALNVVDARTREVSFSAPYVEAGLVLAVPPGSPIGSTADLAGRRVAAEWGSSGDAEARAVQKGLDGNVTLVLRESGDAALGAVGAGQADAVIIDAVSLALYHGAALGPVGSPLRSDPYVMVVPARSPRLLKLVNEALAGLQADGTLAGLRAKWLR
jgi:ABC-type amino acid transport substrate-binding protein